MPGTMSRTDLVADLKASLQDAANVFTAAADADFVRHLDKAALDFGRVRPLMLEGTLTLESGVATYDAPAVARSFVSESWTDACPNQWDDGYPGRLPAVAVIGVGAARKLHFSPAPSARHLAAFGASFAYLYEAFHSISDTAASTTITAGDRGLLLLRAQAEAMRELAMRNVGKPVQMRDGYTGTPRNGTPAALWQSLMQEFEGAA